MEKAKEVIKKHENIFIIFFIILMIIGYCFNIYLGTGDEIWNFQNIYKMLNGYKIYTDANVITTPLFHFIGYLFLRIFGQNILVFRIYNIFIMTIMYFLLYKILGKLSKNKFSIFVYFFIIMIETIMLCAGGANYNALAINFVLLGVYLNLKWIEEKKQHNFKQGIIMFLVLFTKQNIGAFYILGICLYQLIKERNIKNIIKQIVTLGILVGISMIIFIHFGIFNDFINYAVLGIGEFAKENIGGSIINLIKVLCFAIFVSILTVFLIKKKIMQDEDKNKLLLLVILSIPLMLIGYPIYNEYHTTLVNLLLFLTIFYILDYIFFSNMSLGKWKKIVKIFLILLILVYMYVSILHFISWFINSLQNKYFDNSHPFYGGYLKEENKKEFEIITNYVANSEENVIILTEDAALYIIPLKRNNGAMDLPFLGNMGKNGEDNIIQKIEEMKNTKFLIKKDEKDLFWQESKKINQYIKENLDYIRDIEKFSIYEKK